ncbi:MAG TPA: polysaccharide deacetylase family protein [Bacteroidia bacterium]|nr:polysaccharide deacetylase family protein [Bacteroidia bacterium]
MPWLIPSVTWKMPAGSNTIYLTFDDGPHPEITPWVMDLLDRHHAKATFFCVGDNVRKYPEIFKQLTERGHSVGNHTFNHLNGWNTGNFTYLKNIALCDAYTHSPLFRPPYGKLGLAQLKALKKKYKIIYWTILSRDFETDLNTDESLAYMKEHTAPGSIVLFHDSVKAEKNMKLMLPEFLEYFAGRGMEFKGL